MGAISVISRVESDDFVTENVVSWCDIRWDCNSPGVVVSDQGIGGPVAWDCGIVNESYSVDLEKLQSGLINSLAITVAVCEVIYSGCQQMMKWLWHCSYQ